MKKIKKMVKKLHGWKSAIWLLAFLAVSSPALAAGGKPATQLVNVADTRMMEPGFNKWLADIYNSNHWLYGLVVVVIMAGMGLSLGLTFDRLIGFLGIDLGKIDHHE